MNNRFTQGSFYHYNILNNQLNQQRRTINQLNMPNMASHLLQSGENNLNQNAAAGAHLHSSEVDSMHLVQ